MEKQAEDAHLSRRLLSYASREVTSVQLLEVFFYPSAVQCSFAQCSVRRFH